MTNQTKQAYVAAHELAIEGLDANSAGRFGRQVHNGLAGNSETF